MRSDDRARAQREAAKSDADTFPASHGEVGRIMDSAPGAHLALSWRGAGVEPGHATMSRYGEPADAETRITVEPRGRHIPFHWVASPAITSRMPSSCGAMMRGGRRLSAA